MNVKPMIFNAEMVKALLDGRKTMTRRICKPQPPEGLKILGPEVFTPATFDRHGEMVEGKPVFGIFDEDGEWGVKCPFEVGMLLYVREAWGLSCRPCPEQGFLDGLEYRADEDIIEAGKEMCPFYPIPEHVKAEDLEKYDDSRWYPSIHQPRWASRLTLEIESVGIERLAEISEEDAKAEGFAPITKDGKLIKWGIPDKDGYPGNDDHGWPWVEWEVDPRKAFRKLWEAIYGGESWEANPFVWKIAFTVHHKNVDQIIAERKGAA